MRWGAGGVGDQRGVSFADSAVDGGTYYYGACVDAVADEFADLPKLPTTSPWLSDWLSAAWCLGH